MHLAQQFAARYSVSPKGTPTMARHTENATLQECIHCTQCSVQVLQGTEGLNGWPRALARPADSSMGGFTG